MILLNKLKAAGLAVFCVGTAIAIIIIIPILSIIAAVAVGLWVAYHVFKDEIDQDSE